jgi:hypothetical protein
VTKDTVQGAGVRSIRAALLSTPRGKVVTVGTAVQHAVVNKIDPDSALSERDHQNRGNGLEGDSRRARD